MIQQLWQLLKDTAVYGFGRGILLPLGLITLPIFTRVFAPDEFGVIELIATITSLLSIFLIVGMDSAAQRSYFDSSDTKQRTEIISTGLWFLVVWNLLIVVVALLCSRWISSLIFGTSQYADLLQITFITASLALLVVYCQNTIRLHFSPWKFTLVSLLKGTLTVGLSILLVLRFEMGLWGYFVGILAGSAISLAPALYLIREEIVLKFSFKKIKEMLSYGGPLVPAGLAYYVLTMADRYILVRLATLDDVGLYSVAVRVTSLMLFLYGAFSLAWSPYVFKLYSESEERMKEVVSRVMKYILLSFALIAIFLTTFSRELLSLLTTEQYFGAAIAIAPLCLGLVAYATTPVTVVGIGISRKTKYIVLGSVVAAIVNVLLNVLLIPLWGILGASIATAISFTVLTLSYYRIGRKIYPIDFERKAILKICLVCVLFVVIGSFMVFDNLVLGIFVKLAFILLFGAVLFLFRILDAQETAYVRGWFSRLVKARRISDLKTWTRRRRGRKD